MVGTPWAVLVLCTFTMVACADHLNGARKLVQFDDEGVASVHPGGLEMLNAVGSAPVYVIGAMGATRTGKSTFLNKLTGTKAFEVQHTEDPATRGLDMCVHERLLKQYVSDDGMLPAMFGVVVQLETVSSRLLFW
jgi:hypothetical protein